MKSEFFSIGHSNDTLEHFLELLQQHHIDLLVDVRRFPGSRKFPHLGQPSLREALPKAGIEYQWLEQLGGRRRSEKGVSPSRNSGLRNESFRNYADYMTTDDFRAGIEKLLKIARGKRAALMCAEAVFWRCHRRLISDYLLAHHTPVQHIMPSGKLHEHALTSGAVVENGELSYPGNELSD